MPLTSHARTNTMATFDWVPRDQISDVTMGLTLVVVRSDAGGSVTSESEFDDVTVQTQERTHVTVGEAFVGAQAPDDAGLAHWQSMLVQPRKTVVRKHVLH